METRNENKTLEDRVRKHEKVDLMHVLECNDMETEYPLLLQKRTADELSKVSGNLEKIYSKLVELCDILRPSR